MRQEYKLSDNSRGFSLIELMIVIAIIGILVGVGVPAWRTAVMAANETSAIETISTVSKEQRAYYISTKSYATFDQLIERGALDKRFAGEQPVDSGYIYTMKVTPKANNQPPFYSINADPQKTEGLSATGKRHFYLDSNIGSTRVSDTQPATADDPPLGQ